MQYQILIDNKNTISGDLDVLIIIFSAIFLTLLTIIIYFLKHIRDNNRMKYEFITIVAHKFRTPLTYIKWVCDSLIPDEADSFKKKSLEDVKKSNQKLIDLTGTLIEIADSESSGGVTYVYEKIPLVELMQDIINKNKDSFHEKNIFLGFKFTNNKIKVKADRTRLEFVINTLLDNARTYTPIGKKVELAVSGSLFKASIIVEDDGIGISKQDIKHVFSKFFRGKNARVNDTEGFGVGLYLASSIIKKLKGKITVESPGENLGSRFMITLPRVR
jgi:signal transduction histidine kinase